LSERRNWTLLIVPDGDQAVRQYRVARFWVLLAAAAVLALAIYAVVETYLFWVVAAKARQVAPLVTKLRELESSNQELQEMGAQLTELRSFEAQLRRALLTHVPDTLPEPPLQSKLGMQVSPALHSPGAVQWEGSDVEPSLVRGFQEHTLTPADLPTYPPVRGYITREFQRQGMRAGRAHLGVDIAARLGAPVCAAASGLVVFADWTYGYGNLAVIEHRSGYVSLYGHNEVLLVSPRQYVEQGQPIALLGNSGRSSAPHLHFEIWRANEPMDPMTFLTAE
jgi:murein DD-endopeptidase MepM/ murein hydrolase activator NlpD